MEFENYIEAKIRIALKVNKKRGKQRDVSLLAEILNAMFWMRNSPERECGDILPAIHPKHKELKPDTLGDNLEFLTKIGNPPFLKVSKKMKKSRRRKVSEEGNEISIYSDLKANIDRGTACLLSIPKAEGRPSNTYSLNDHYIEDYYLKEGGLESGIITAIRCNKPPMECPVSSCKICQANNIKTCWD